MAVMTFGADNEEVKGYSFKSWKAKGGEKYRVGFVYPDGDSKKMFVGVPIHYAERYFICKSTPEKKAICCTHTYKGNKPRWRVGGVMVIYEMSDKKLRGYKLVPWVFTDKMYQKIKTANEEFPLATHDLILSCTNEEFQTIEPQPCKESFWQMKEELKKKIITEAASIFSDIGDNLASDLPIEEIKELLGIDDAGSGDAAENVELGDVLADM
jgi:hypothetical protein